MEELSNITFYENELSSVRWVLSGIIFPYYFARRRFGSLDYVGEWTLFIILDLMGV